MNRRKQKQEADFEALLSSLGRDAAAKPAKAAAEPRVDQEDDAPSTADPERAARAVHRLRGLLGGFAWQWPFRRTGNLSETAAAYAEEAANAEERREAVAADGRRIREPPKVEAPLSEDDAIAEELGLRAGLAEIDLRQLRREFAKKNHPDQFGPTQRMRAARRMSIANMLIDQHLKQQKG
ncbi:hypothetical protein [Methylocapsa acidiphila]|uniref:hypothetical protein n=1 Tax=Methylocapsa acidiphila TaxID=133552 RepID=UPI0003F9E8E6|nr:hypothetical protein [Methylocapsa acidiphila]